MSNRTLKSTEKKKLKEKKSEVQHFELKGKRRVNYTEKNVLIFFSFLLIISLHFISIEKKNPKN